MKVLENEIWKPIKGYEGLYEISSFGKVLTVKRQGTSGGFVKVTVRKDGYIQVLLSKDGKQKNHLVHRLVATAFLPMQTGKSQVNHIDGNRNNNMVSNLEWCTAQENTLHSHDVLEKNTKRVICVETGVIYPSIRSAARAVNSDDSTIQRVCAGKRRNKTAAGFHWRYV